MTAALPEKVLFDIVSYLDPKDIKNMKLSYSNPINTIANKNITWKHRVEKYYNQGKTLPEYNVFWKYVYEIVETKGWKGLFNIDEDNIDYIKLAINKGEDPFLKDVEFLILAIRKKHYTIVNLFLEILDQYQVALNVYDEIIGLLLQDKDIIMIAAKKDFYEIAKLLLEYVNPSIMNNYPIRIAVEKGNYDIVKLLLSDARVDPTANNNYAIKTAFDNKDYGMIELLIKDYRVNQSLK
jgi:hypothetical protein